MENLNPKKNPITTIPGILLTAIGCGMYFIEYIAPAIWTLKERLEYTWWQPLAMLGSGLVFLFMNDEYFGQMFGISKKIVQKVSHTEETTTTITDKKE